MASPHITRSSSSRPLAGVAMALLWLLPCGPASGAEDKPWLVTLRDGSRFRATLPPVPLELGESGGTGNGIVHTPVALGDLAGVEFSLTPAQDKIEAIAGAVATLDAEAFDDRERATVWLLGNTLGFRPLLDRRLGREELPPEVRWRLGAVLDRLPKDPPVATQRPFDRLYPEGGGTRDGDLGNFELPATFRGSPFPLTRRSVASMTRVREPTGDPEKKATRRLESPEDPVFAMEARSLGFDTDTEGRPLNVGDDIGQRFVGDGVVFSTSAEHSFVSVNTYEVSGPSRGLSAATHDPLYEGTVTIRFCMPGNPGVPAGVQGVGLWLAVVRLDGTTLQALDASGEILDEIKTTGKTSDFLGLWSETPIHAIRLIPNVDIDENYTIDDLIFTPQRPVDGLGVAEYPTLGFRNGDRVVCREFTILEGEIRFRPASFEAVTVSAPLTDVRTLYAPLKTKSAPFDQGHHWIELADGTRLLSSSGEAQSFPRLPDLPLEPLPLVALWGPASVPSPPPASVDWNPADGPLLVDERGARTLPPARLGAQWIEPLDKGFPEGVASTYAESPTIWFARPEKTGSGTGLVRFPNGERLVLGGSAGFRLQAITTDEITVERDGQTWTFPFSETNAVRLPAP